MKFFLIYTIIQFNEKRSPPECPFKEKCQIILDGNSPAVTARTFEYGPFMIQLKQAAKDNKTAALNCYVTNERANKCAIDPDDRKSRLPREVRRHIGIALESLGSMDLN